jgi:hypothetical protein
MGEHGEFLRPDVVTEAIGILVISLDWFLQNTTTSAAGKGRA